MKFGIIGPGSIARKFADACSRTDCAEVVAVASTKKERADAFAKDFQIPRSYGSYDELLWDESVDAVYISLVNTGHYQAVKECILAGKSVLCEKPMCLTAGETQELCDLAKRQGVLLAEGIWTLSLPCIRKAQEWLADKAVGTVKMIKDSFLFYTPVDPSVRLYDRSIGGGAVYDVGIYCLSFMAVMNQSGVCSLNSSLYIGETGVDEMGAFVMHFSDGAVGSAEFGFQGNVSDDAVIYGSEGRIVIPHFWRSRRAELYNARGEITEVFEDPRENGFTYEIEAFVEAYEHADTQMKAVPHALSVRCAKWMDQILANACRCF